MGQLKANNKNVVHEKEGNIVVVNTCGFIDNAKEESINVILEQSKNKRDGKIDKLYVTGCLSQRYKEDLIIQIPEVDEYFGTTDLPSLLKVLDANYMHELVGERILTTPKHYAYLKISEGCNRPCSFCAIPLMRGKHTSISIENLVFQANKLASEGVVEIILIAQDLTYYGLDLYKKRSLAKLLKELVKIEGIHWIRLHYAFPTGFPLDVLEVIKNNNKICNYLDIPLQEVEIPVLTPFPFRSTDTVNAVS
jgi:ribosomal protein S12 methylthiotransferase